MIRLTKAGLFTVVLLAAADAFAQESAPSRPGRIGAGTGARPAESSPTVRATGLSAERVHRRNSQASSLYQTDKAVLAGLEWLRRHQSPAGSWDCDGFSARCDKTRGAACEGPGAGVFDIGVTARATLAFLGAGYDDQRPGPYRDAVASALKFLASTQDAQGCFGPTADNRHVYPHAAATIAMWEAFASSAEPAWLKCGEGALTYIQACQNPYKGWRYGVQPGDNDASVTGWMLMAYRAARDAGFRVNEKTVLDGLAFLDSVTDPNTGRTGYVRRGERPVRPEGLAVRWPSEETESLTALATCARIWWGREHEASQFSTFFLVHSKVIPTSATLIGKTLPRWDEPRGSIDMYYWYYGTMAMFQIGGADWERWNKSLKTTLLDHQLKKGCAEGSWDPKDAWGEEGGRVYSTAFMTLCLEVYYRYPRVYRAPPPPKTRK